MKEERDQSRSIREIIVAQCIIIERGCIDNVCVPSYKVSPPPTHDCVFEAVMMSDETIRLVPEISPLKEKHVPEDAAIQRPSKERLEMCGRR